jgi:hypothetical protein
MLQSSSSTFLQACTNVYLKYAYFTVLAMVPCCMRQQCLCLRVDTACSTATRRRSCIISVIAHYVLQLLLLTPLVLQERGYDQRTLSV